MHIALSGWFWDRLETGSGQYVRRLAEAIVAAEPDIILDVFVPSETGNLPFPDRASNLRLIPRTIPKTQIGKLRWEQMLVGRWAREVGAELIHIPYWAPPLFAPLPVVVTAHDIIPLVLPPYRGGWHVRAYTALVSAATLRANLVLTDSEASRRDILARLHVASDRVRAIPLALGDAYSPTPEDQDQQLRDEMGVSGPYVLYVGGFDIRKNVGVIFEAFKFIARACPEASLVIAGRLPATDTAFMPQPRRLAREAGLTDAQTRFVGFVTEAQKLSLYRGARAFVFPSQYEGFGYPPLEALACGVPVVASNASSLPEIVGDAGVLLAPQDVEGIAGALIQLLIDPDFRSELTQRGLVQSRRFSWQRTAQETLTAYRDLI